MIRATTIGYGSTAVVSRLLGVPPRRVRKMVARGDLERLPSDLGIPLYPLWPVKRLAVLRALPGSADEVAARIEVSSASVHRVLISLEEDGLVAFNGRQGVRGRPGTSRTISPAGASHLRALGLKSIETRGDATDL